MKRLADIGFKKVGAWKIVNDVIIPTLTDLFNLANVL